MKSSFFAIVIAAAATLVGCDVKNPPLTGIPKAADPAAVYTSPAGPPKSDPIPFERHFKFARSQSTVKQQKFNENLISVFFQVSKDGQSVNDLKETELRVHENSVEVRPFTLAATKERQDQVADIVFLVDITGTMVEFIESAKVRLKEFIKTSRQRGYHTRMCISTFGDHVVKTCDRFFDNNPNDASTTKQVEELLTELAQLQAFRGAGRDPGWPDLDENPMGALIEASRAPWGHDSQRFVILVTDWGFLYSPDNQGTIGSNAPAMKQVTEAIKASQMKVFAVTRTEHTHRGQHLIWDGYNTPFQGEPGVVQSSGGEYFDFDRVLRGQVSLADILERILKRINTTYKLTYIVDQIQGLDPTLSVDKRNVQISLLNAGKGTVKRNSVLSSMPTGRPQYQQSWKISDSVIQSDSMKINVDGKELAPSEYTIDKGTVRFKTVPKAGADIRFQFLYEAIEKNFRLEPISFAGKIDLKTVKVYLNDKEAKPEDLIFANDLEGNTSLTLAPSVIASNDPYGARKNEGLKIRVVATLGR